MCIEKRNNLSFSLYYPPLTASTNFNEPCDLWLNAATMTIAAMPCCYC